jgi:hypothetical protein
MVTIYSCVVSESFSNGTFCDFHHRFDFGAVSAGGALTAVTSSCCGLAKPERRPEKNRNKENV